MNLLAIDTSTEACSAAILNGEQEYARFEIQPNQHSHLILPMIESLLAETGLHQNQLDAIAFGCGPGSFTGLRIVASITQGIAFAHDLPVIPVSSLQTMAQTAYQEWGYKKILSAIDAHVQSFYYGAFGLNETSGCVEPVCSEELISPQDWKMLRANAYFREEWQCIGTGWRYFELDANYYPNYYPKASAMLILAKKAFMQKKWIAPEEALPVYLHELNYLQK